VGKSIGRDLEKGKLTLPMILHIAGTRGEERHSAVRAIEAKDGNALRAALAASGSIDAARAEAVRIVEEAKLGLPYCSSWRTAWWRAIREQCVSGA